MAEEHVASSLYAPIQAAVAALAQTLGITETETVVAVYREV